MNTSSSFSTASFPSETNLLTQRSNVFADEQASEKNQLLNFKKT